jgi:hypothetical protein
MCFVGLRSRISPTAERPTFRALTPCVDPFALPSITSRVAGAPRGFNAGHAQAYGDGRHFGSIRSSMHSRVSSSSRIEENWSEPGSNPASPTSSGSTFPGASSLCQPCQWSLPANYLRTDTFPRSTWLIDELFGSFSRTPSFVLSDSPLLSPCTHWYRS